MAELIMKLLEEFVEQALGLDSKCVSQNASLELACQESCSHCRDYEVGKSGSHYPTAGSVTTPSQIWPMAAKWMPCPLPLNTYKSSH